MSDPYATAPLECDLVMKGGVTSGIIYPSTVCELARTYRFRAVGGASAGQRRPFRVLSAHLLHSGRSGTVATLAASAPGWDDGALRDRTPAPAPVLRLTTELDETNLR